MKQFDPQKRRAGSKLAPLFSVVACAFFTGPIASANTSTVPGVSDFRFQNPSTGLHDYILGPACLSMRAGPLELDCNPAFLADETKRQFRVNLAANDQVSKVNDYRKMLGTGDSVGIVNAALGQSTPVIAQATTEAWYQHDFWAVGYTPFRGGFSSLAENPAYPQISADIYEESDFFAKAGFVASEDGNIQAGVQARYANRQFYSKQFDLLNAVGDPSLLQIQSQKALYIEPGISYKFDEKWSSALSAMLTQIPVYQDGYQESLNPVFDIGFSTAPPFFGGKLRTTTHYNGNPDVADVFARFVQGAIYDISDIGAVSMSLGKDEAGIGVNGHYESLALGVGWKTEQITADQWQSARVSTFLFEGGLVF